MAHPLKTAYEKERIIGPLYTSGPVSLTTDGKYILTCVGEDVLLTEILSGKEICRFAGDTQQVSSFCVTPNSSHLAVFTSSLSLRIYQLPNNTKPLTKPVQPIRVVSRAHDAPVHVCKPDPTSTYLASGSADGVVKVWHISHGYVTHVFKGHGGVVSALAFSYHSDPSSVVQSLKMQLVTASVDTRIRIFDLPVTNGQANTKPIAILEGHVSVPRGLDISQDGRWLVSGGRDSVILIWDLNSQPQDKNNKGKGHQCRPALAKTIPALERVEAVGFLSTDDEPGSSTKNMYVYAGGQKGVIHVWDGRQGQILYTLGTEKGEDFEEQEEQREIVDILYNPSSSTLVSVHADQNILLFDTTTKVLTRQLIGYNDEIVDTSFILSPSQNLPQIAFATNSSLIRVYSTANFDARLLSGHTDIVLCLDHGPKGTQFLASGGKDRSARIWAPVQSLDTGWGWGCVAVCTGHAESVGAIAMNRTSSDGSRPSFLFTGSQDRTVKMWDLSGIPVHYSGDDKGLQKPKSLTTLKAHEKDINSLDISPNDQLLVSGSQDRTAKVFQIIYSPTTASRAAHGEIKLLGTLKGHKRGVWSVKFDRTERVVATGSGDKTVKLWNLNDFTCVRTFEGHTNSVLRVEFFNHGTQVASAASDGLVKLWSVKDEECVETLDNHEDKIWALAISEDDKTIVSGAADSVITFWKDCTVEQAAKKEAERESLVHKEQDFLNFVALHDYQKAIELALAMAQPGRLFKLFKSIQATAAGAPTSPSVSGNAAVDKVICTLSGSELVKLLGYVRDWNANAKTSGVAQALLLAIVKLRPASDILKAFEDGNGVESPPKAEGGGIALKELLDGLIPYSERHLSRIDRLVQESFIIDFVLSEMDEGVFDGEDSDDSMLVDG